MKKHKKKKIYSKKDFQKINNFEFIPKQSDLAENLSIELQNLENPLIQMQELHRFTV